MQLKLSKSVFLFHSFSTSVYVPVIDRLIGLGLGRGLKILYDIYKYIHIETWTYTVMILSFKLKLVEAGFISV